MGKSMGSNGQWDDVNNSWDLWSSPLRPCADDIALISNAVNIRHGYKEQITALILGSTPEFTKLSLECDCNYFAVDKSRSMLKSVWNGKRSQAICSDWQSIPWIDETFDLILCDGGLQLLKFPDTTVSVITEVERLLKEQGLFICRNFAKRVSQEDPFEIIEDLFANTINDTNELKLRIWPSLQQSVEQGVILDDVWKFLNKNVGPWDELANKLKWDLDKIKVLDLYRGNKATMHFCTQKEFASFVSINSNFSKPEILYGSYKMHEQCPIFIFQK